MKVDRNKDQAINHEQKSTTRIILRARGRPVTQNNARHFRSIVNSKSEILNRTTILVNQKIKVSKLTLSNLFQHGDRNSGHRKLLLLLLKMLLICEWKTQGRRPDERGAQDDDGEAKNQVVVVTVTAVID